MSVFQHLKKGFHQIVYPDVCLGCGHPVDSNLYEYVCEHCMEGGFALASESDQQNILPAHVISRKALWKFDHGGRLQQLLHHLKYYRIPTLGFELGTKLGKQFEKELKSLRDQTTGEAVIVPVPLHQRKYRKRGYNQARKLASGVAKQTGIPLIPQHHVVRNRNTASQTGFTMRQRLRNIAEAFTVNDQTKLRGRMAIIVDDVFTTGSTTFELARTLIDSGSSHCVILTLAEA